MLTVGPANTRLQAVEYSFLHHTGGNDTYGCIIWGVGATAVNVSLSIVIDVIESNVVSIRVKGWIAKQASKAATTVIDNYLGCPAISIVEAVDQ
ncbi:hypothetical protein KUIN1_01920 [Pseudomonas sp. KUIN-1]|nr:hypothetical protein KUIN1_01920 [Pseudomonas sp. KUIN-1]